MKRFVRTILGPIIVVATLVAFIYYAKTHPEIIDQFRHMPVGTGAVILILMTFAFLAYVWVTRLSLSLYGKTMGKQENLLFNAYSSLINFFGPGQSGPLFRGVYLKKRHNVTVKQYLLATLLYFGFYGVFNVLLVFAAVRPWWQTVLLVVVAAIASVQIIKYYRKKSKIGDSAHLGPKVIGLIGLATLLQVAFFAATYGVELRAVDGSISFGQILSYTGVANLALFVSITPGGIGIRESFLLFSQNLHGIDSATVVAASILDRAVYLLFLGALFLLVISLHAKDKLRVSQLKLDESDKL